MRRKSTGLASQNTEGSDKSEIKNTGLRPTWDEFWAVETDGFVPMKSQRLKAESRTVTASTTGTFKSESAFKTIKFISGSEWCGEWDKLGMSGVGVYKMPTGVVYEGTMSAGLFEGIGELKYPNGGILEGFWHEGKLKYCQYEYADGLKRDNVVSWPYCQMPDRRFYSEMQHGLKPANNEQVSNEDPPRDLPPRHYDVGDGLYNPRTKCVIDPYSGDTLRIPTVIYEEWILENCRKKEIDTVGYRPDLYENWYRERKTDDLCNRNIPESEKEILALILQEDGDLVSRRSSSLSQDRTYSWQSKLDNISLRELRSLGSIWSRTDFEAVLKKLKEKEQEKGASLISFCDDIDDVDDLSMIKLLQEIALTYSGKIDKVLHTKKLSPSEIGLLKKLTTSDEQQLLDVLRTLSVDSAFERDIMHSSSVATNVPFSYDYSKLTDGKNTTVEKILSQPHRVQKKASAGLEDKPSNMTYENDCCLSEVHMNVDYSIDSSDYVPEF